MLALVALVAGAAAAATPAPGPAAEGSHLVQALETAPLGVVGTVEGRVALDERSWRATLVVESVLVGEAAPGQRLVVAWEELTARPPRFANGDRVLVALEPLVAGSLWRKRFADPRQLATALGIAERGTAFLRAPSAGSLSVLQHYLSLPIDLRESPAGQRHLLSLAASAERPLALSASDRLASVAGGEPPGAEAAELALRALARAEEERQLASPLLVWIERLQPLGLVPALDAALAAPGGAPATFVVARGLLGDGVPAERERVLLASPSAPQRAAAARVASPAQAEKLAQLLSRDPAPEVRKAALLRLARLEGSASLENLLEAFDDPDSTVRNAAALQCAAFGAGVVPRLAQVAEWPWPASESAVVALGHSKEQAARVALETIAEAHADERVRTLASIALGRGVGHGH